MSRDGESSVANAEISFFEKIAVDIKPLRFVIEEEIMSAVVTSLGGTNSIDADEEDEEDDAEEEEDADEDDEEEDADEEEDEEEDADGNKGSTNTSSSATSQFISLFRFRFNGRTIPSSPSPSLSPPSPPPPPFPFFIFLSIADMSSGATKSSVEFSFEDIDEKRGPTNVLAFSFCGWTGSKRISKEPVPT
jgi:hypothetical protein